jgi:hypothetical protein
MSGRVTPAKPKRRGFQPMAFTDPNGHKPNTKQRSPWRVLQDLGDAGVWYARDVSDGALRALVADEPAGWHLSISFVDHRMQPTRYPKWDEQVDAVRQLLPPELTYAMFITPDDEFVALHQSTFHWWEAVNDGTR